MSASALLIAPTIPPSYHIIVSQTLHIPSDPQTPVPVGLLACQRNPVLRELDTTVVSCNVSRPPAASTSNKKAKKAVLAPSLPANPLLEVICQDTVIFPEGGGQPTDIGTITTSDNRVWDVLQCKRHGGFAVHYVRIVNDDVAIACKVFAPGSKVKVALGEEGFSRRYDHMSMHTSQHLLSALLENRLNLPTLSWSMTAYPAPCYVEVPRGMAPSEIQMIQTEANRLVFEGRKVHVEVQELDRSQENGVATLENGRAVGKALPEDYTGGVKRVIVIDGVDRNPCCGTHLPSLHNLQLFLLPHTDTLSRSATTSARLYFLAGPRLIAQLTSTHHLLTDAASMLSCGAPLVPERVAQVVEERKKAEKRVEELEAELAQSIAFDLLQEAALDKADVFAKVIYRNENAPNALGFLTAVSSAFANALLTSSTPSRPYCLVFSSSPASQTNTCTSVVLVSGSEENLVRKLGEELKAKLGIKGGGKGSKWSGKYIGVWKEGREGKMLNDLLNAVVFA